MVTFFQNYQHAAKPDTRLSIKETEALGAASADGSTFRQIHMPEDHDLHRTHERCQLAADTSLSTLLFPGVDVEAFEKHQ